MEPLFLRSWLDPLVDRCRLGYLDSDPIGIVHGLSSPRDQEVGGLFAAALALGRVATIRQRTAELFDRLDGAPASVLVSASLPVLRRRLKGFRHRFFVDEDLLELAVNVGRLLREHGSLGECWRVASLTGGDVTEGKRGASFTTTMDRFAAALNEPVSGVTRRASIPLAPAPRDGSTCKRMAMYLRWMVRPADGVDFGFWTHVSPADLVMPLDTHIFRVSGLLGLTRARASSWRVACEVTDALRLCDPRDPVKYDFALSRLGIVHGCRGRFDAEVCPGCPVQPVCEAGRVSGRAKVTVKA